MLDQHGMNIAKIAHRSLDGVWQVESVRTCPLLCGFSTDLEREGKNQSKQCGFHQDKRSGLLKGGELLQDDAQAQWGVLAYAVLLSALVSFSCIHYFLKLIERMGFLPFVIYRVLMGIGLLFVHFSLQA